MLNDFQANQTIFKLIEQQEDYREVLHLCQNIYDCLRSRSELSIEEQIWMNQLKKYLPENKA